MPYLFNENYSTIITIPDGYNLDEVPPSFSLKLNTEGDIQFDYKVTQISANTNKVQSKMEIKRAQIQVAEYELIRELFNRVVAKQNEQVVLKKIK